MKKTSFVSAGQTPGIDISTDDLLFHKKEHCLKAAYDAIARLMLDRCAKETPLANVATIDGGTVEDLPALVATAISKPYGSLGVDTSQQWGATTSKWYRFQHQAEDFLRGKIDKCRMRKLDTTAQRLHLALGCLRWAGFLGVRDVSGFQSHFTTALIFDRDATSELNGETIDVAPLETDTPLTNAMLSQIVEMLKQQGNKMEGIAEDASIAAAKNLKDLTTEQKKSIRYRKIGFGQEKHIRKYNEEKKDEAREAALLTVTKKDEADYPNASTTRPHGYWKNLLEEAKPYSFPSADALRKAVMRKRSEKRGKYPRKGKKRGQYKNRI